MDEILNEEIGIALETKRWLYIPLGILIFMCMGTVYSWSVFRSPVEESLNISATQSGLPYMVFLLFYALLMPVASGFINDYGPRLVTMLGGVLVGLGWFLSSFVTSVNQLIITYGVIAGAGVGIAYGAPMVVAARWFPDKRGLAVGLTLGGFGISPVITAPLSRWLIDSYGLFQTFRILGIAFTIIVIILALPLRFPKDESEIEYDKLESEKKKKAINFTAKDMIKNKAFYGLWICFSIGTLTGLTIIGISSPVAQEIINLDAQIASLMVALFAIFNAAGRPIFGTITDNFGAKRAAILSFSLIILSSVLMLNNQEGSMVLYIISFSVLWLSSGGWLAIAPAATAALFGNKHYTKNYGIVFLAYGIGAISGNLIAGNLRDMLGSYIYTFYPIIILAGLGIIAAVFLLKMPQETIE
ncbi:OFA family MFS transporter [Natroniella sulfidigena]|uniref:L-lactate MFS transporter n=1 Tax=Natroniella sulfidigena TaxID=723921 RepID=UPI00200B1487|nr:OFA family MFS transporter [Natroniella sulfidigena]MCK8818212.1 OFA family MFS transporter [Natroniella sulfidigena]